VRGHEDGFALFSQPAQTLPQQPDVLDIQTVEWFIQHNQPLRA